MTAFFDFPKQALNDIGSTDGLPVRLGKGIEGQARLQIALQAVHRRGVKRLELLTEGSRFLVGLTPTS